MRMMSTQNTENRRRRPARLGLYAYEIYKCTDILEIVARDCRKTV